MRIQDQPIEERPYEKFSKYGPDYLSNAELLAILLRSGTKTYNAEELAWHLLTYGEKEKPEHIKTPSLIGLYHISYNELMSINGIGPVKAIQILTLLELSKRITKEKYQSGEKITSPAILSCYFMEELRHSREERFIITLLDAKCKMIGYETVSKGSLTASIVHPREVYRIAIQKSAHSIIAVHNHPSGDPTPSEEDLQMTKRLQKVGDLVGIPLLDHIIIGDGIYKSFKEESYL